MISDTITIYQKDWAFTTADSLKPKIETHTFGPCYVVTFTCSKSAAMAHIDDCTQVDSIASIFDKFKEKSIDTNKIKVMIFGGWKTHPSSFEWGQKIIEKIKAAGVQNLSTKNMYLKSTLKNENNGNHNMSDRQLSKYYHCGACVDSRTGETHLLKKFNNDADTEQLKQNIEFKIQNRNNLDIELPLKQITL